MVFDASGSRMAWTLIEQLQGEPGGGGGEARGRWAGLGNPETSQDGLGASAVSFNCSSSFQLILVTVIVKAARVWVSVSELQWSCSSGGVCCFRVGFRSDFRSFPLVAWGEKLTCHLHTHGLKES